MVVTPHPAFVARISARRGERDFAPPLPKLDLDAEWKAAQRLTIGNKKHPLHTRLKNDPHVKKAVAVLEAGALPEPFDAKTVAVAERLLRVYHDEPVTLVRVIAESRGLAEMVAVKLESTAIGLSRNDEPLTFDSDTQWLEAHNVSWNTTRAVICRSDDASYVAAREVASAWREKRSVKMRIASSYFFPSETAWANVDFDERLMCAKTDSWIYHYMFPLLSVITDEARVTSLIDHIVAAGQTYQLQNMMGRAACEIVMSLAPEGALRVLQLLLAKGGRGANKTEVAVLGHAMAAIEGEDAAAELAGLLLHSPIGPVAVDYFRRFPELATTVLPKVASGTSKVADAARSILASQKKNDDSPLAEGDEVPRLLRDAPWRKKKKKVKAVTVGELPPLPKAIIVWSSDQEKADLLAGPLLAMTADVANHWAQLRSAKPVDVYTAWGGNRYRVPDEDGLREWTTNSLAQAYLGPLYMLAVHGSAALKGLFLRDAFASAWGGERLFEAQLRAVGAESARIVASALARRKAWRKRAQEWIASHGDVVAQTLLPVALGKDSRERKEAEHAVRWAARSHRDAVLQAGKALGEEAEKATRELVDRDPLTDLEVKGKLPPFIRVETLPAIKTKDGKRLPDDAVNALLEILRSTSPDFPYAGLEAIQRELDAASLGEFAWALVQAWILAGGKGAFAWIPLSLALIGDDSCARRLAPYVREWARKDAKKAMMATDVLAAMGSSVALLHLSYVADKSRFEEARKHARETLDSVAAQQGITAEELADRTVPDLDLDEDGTAKLDFGARSFTVTFDEGLLPVIKAEDGTRLPQFPRGTKTDDAAKVKLASARFKGLKTDAETVALTLLRRFERAMCNGRTWRADAFRTYVLNHPLVTHLAKRLIWQTPKGTFRVAHDGTLADAEDAEVALAGEAMVSLPHPLVLGKDGVAAWSRIAADYAIVQPFEQLGRATYTLAEGEVQSSTLERYSGKTSKPGPLMGSLVARGWQKWPNETSLSSCGKTVRTKSGGEGQVSLSFEPGIELSDVANAPDQTLHAPSLSGAASWASVDEIDLSELVRDLELIAH